MTVVITIFKTFQDTQQYPFIPWHLTLPVNILALGAASQYIDGFLEFYCRNCVVILATTCMPLYYVTSDNGRKDA